MPTATTAQGGRSRDDQRSSDTPPLCRMNGQWSEAITPPEPGFPRVRPKKVGPYAFQCPVDLLQRQQSSAVIMNAVRLLSWVMLVVVSATGCSGVASADTASSYYVCHGYIGQGPTSDSHPWSILIVTKVFKAAPNNSLTFSNDFVQWIKDNYSSRFHVDPQFLADSPPKVHESYCEETTDENRAQGQADYYYTKLRRPQDTAAELVDWRPGQAAM